MQILFQILVSDSSIFSALAYEIKHLLKFDIVALFKDSVAEWKIALF